MTHLESYLVVTSIALLSYGLTQLVSKYEQARLRRRLMRRLGGAE